MDVKTAIIIALVFVNLAYVGYRVYEHLVIQRRIAELESKDDEDDKKCEDLQIRVDNLLDYVESNRDWYGDFGAIPADVSDGITSNMLEHRIEESFEDIQKRAIKGINHVDIWKRNLTDDEWVELVAVFKAYGYKTKFFHAGLVDVRWGRTDQ